MRSKGHYGLFGLGVLFVAGEGPLAAIYPVGAIIIPSVVLAVVAFANLPLNILVGMFGAVLPIWSVAGLNPMFFDAARLSLAGAIFLRAHSSARRLWTESMGRLTLTLGLIGFVLTVVGVVRPDPAGVILGYTMVIAVSTAWIALSRIDDFMPLLRGYLIGVSISAAVLIISGLGFGVLTPRAGVGIDRLVGLSSSATQVGYELAVGVVIAVAGISQLRSRVVFFVCFAICVSAMLMSGGRGGVAAIGIALLVGVRWRWIRIVPALLTGGIGWIVLARIIQSGQTLNTLSRFEGTGQKGAEFTAGREDLFSTSIAAIERSPFFGTGLSQFQIEYGHGLNPHFAFFLFYVAGGVIPGLLILAILIFIIHRVTFRSACEDGFGGHVAYLMFAVFLAMAILEPSGPFVGTAKTTLLLIAVGMTSTPASQKRLSLSEDLLRTPKTDGLSYHRVRVPFMTNPN
jgi:hypothetical protein